MLPTPVFLPGEFHGQGSLTGYSPWARRVSDITKQLTLALHLGSWLVQRRAQAALGTEGWGTEVPPRTWGTFVLPAPLCVCYRGGTRGMPVSDEWIHEWIKLTWMEVKFNVNEKNKHHSEDTLKNNSHFVRLFTSFQMADSDVWKKDFFPRQEYWSGLPFPFPEDLPNPGAKPESSVLAGWFFTAEVTRETPSHPLAYKITQSIKFNQDIFQGLLPSEMAHTLVCGVCFSLNKSTSYLSTVSH